LALGHFGVLLGHPFEHFSASVFTHLFSLIDLGCVPLLLELFSPRSSLLLDFAPDLLERDQI
jgi:hypothetical protein